MYNKLTCRATAASGAAQLAQRSGEKATAILSSPQMRATFNCKQLYCTPSRAPRDYSGASLPPRRHIPSLPFPVLFPPPAAWARRGAPLLAAGILHMLAKGGSSLFSSLFCFAWRAPSLHGGGIALPRLDGNIFFYFSKKHCVE